MAEGRAGQRALQNGRQEKQVDGVHGVGDRGGQRSRKKALGRIETGRGVWYVETRTQGRGHIWEQVEGAGRSQIRGHERSREKAVQGKSEGRTEDETQGETWKEESQDMVHGRKKVKIRRMD